VFVQQPDDSSTYPTTLLLCASADLFERYATQNSNCPVRYLARQILRGLLLGLVLLPDVSSTYPTNVFLCASASQLERSTFLFHLSSRLIACLRFATFHTALAPFQTSHADLCMIRLVSSTYPTYPTTVFLCATAFKVRLATLRIFP
jgi:hypothetical protein